MFRIGKIMADYDELATGMANTQLIKNSFF